MDSPEEDESSFVHYLQRGQKITFPCMTLIAVDILGEGSYGQVYEVEDISSQKHFALKVSLNRPGIGEQLENEIRVHSFLKSECPTDLDNICKLVASHIDPIFIFAVYEMNSINLFNLLVQRQNRGFMLDLIQFFLRQCTSAISVLHRYSIIHSDIKPENIMITQSNQVKLIDFGGASFPDDEIPFYIQSRYYRAPEVFLELPPTTAIDIWSLGCVICELFLGYPIFCGYKDSLHMLRMMQTRLGPFPSSLLRMSTVKNQFFDSNDRCLEPDPFEDRVNFNYGPLELILRAMGDRLPNNQSCDNLDLFIDLIKAMLTYDPEGRITIFQIQDHPFMHIDFHLQR